MQYNLRLADVLSVDQQKQDIADAMALHQAVKALGSGDSGSMSNGISGDMSGMSGSSISGTGMGASGTSTTDMGGNGTDGAGMSGTGANETGNGATGTGAATP